MKKKNKYTNADARCPFYKCEERNMVYCKGVQEDTSLHLAFAYPSDKYSYRTEKCEADYENCRIYKLLEEVDDDDA